MTDLEMVRLCAEAYLSVWDTLDRKHYEYTVFVEDGAVGILAVRIGHPDVRQVVRFDPWTKVFDPRHDDAQAMKLVKRFKLMVCQPSNNEWSATYFAGRRDFKAGGADLNRAIVECVAKMQAAKVAVTSSA